MRRASVLVAVGLVCAAALGCQREHRSPDEQVRSGMDAARAAVREAVADAPRREVLLGKMDEFEQLLEAQFGELNEAARLLQELNADPTAERAAFDQVLVRFRTSRRERRAHALDVHFSMIEMTTAEEWEQIAASELEALGPVLQAPEAEG